VQVENQKLKQVLIGKNEKKPPSRKLKQLENHAWLTLKMYDGIVTYDDARIDTIHT